MTQIMKGVYCPNFKLYQNEFGLYNLTKKMCSSILTSPPQRKSAGNPRKKNSMELAINQPFSDAPYIVRGVSTYQDVCVCVCVGAVI